MNEKKDRIKMLIMVFVLVILFVPLLFKQYEYTTITKDDLSSVKINFDYFREGPNSKTKKRNIVYSLDGVSFGFESIVDINEDILNKIQKGSEVEIYYRDTKDSYYDYEIIEMYYNNDAIVTLNDYHNDYSEHIKISIIVFIGLIGFLMSLIFILPNLLNKLYNKKNKIEQIDFESKNAIKKYNEFKEAIIYNDEMYLADFTNYFDGGDFDIQILCKYLDDEMDDQEIRLIYDDTNPDEIVYLVFKYNGKIMLEIVFIDNEGNIEIDDDFIDWTFPEYVEFSKLEKEIFNQNIELYSRTYNVNFKYELIDDKSNKIKYKRKKK